MSKRRVVIAGLGIVSPVGNDRRHSAWDSRSWPDAAASGHRNALRHRHIFPTHFGGEIRTSIWSPISCRPRTRRRMDAFMQYGVVAGMQAMRDSGLDGDRGQFGTDRRADGRRAWADSNRSRRPTTSFLETQSLARSKVSPFFIPGSIINLVSGHLSIQPSTSPGRIWRSPPPAPPPPMRFGLGDAAHSIRRSGRDAGRRLGDGDLRHRHERIRAGQGALSQRNDDPARRRAARGTRIATVS